MSQLLLGVDVGSTTVKVVVLESDTRRQIWSAYARHEARQAERLLDLLQEAEATLGTVSSERVRVCVTGSGAGPLCEPLGGTFVQEVNAVTMAVDVLHPDVGSIVELGGQDAKIVIYKDVGPGERRAVASMNDKCASGTGATIDKCVVKVGLSRDALRGLAWNPARLHHVAAKCGVFAETDIVGLIKSGVPQDEVMCSLVDAIVSQNLSVLTRGQTLRPPVLLLGGPNAFLPLLQDCWRQRIPEMWRARGYAYPDERPASELVRVPAHAEYYAAVGAALLARQDATGLGVYRGLEPLRAVVTGGRRVRLGHAAGPPLVRPGEDLEAFRRQYGVPHFQAHRCAPGTRLAATLGLDGGSTSSKAVLLADDGTVLAKRYQLSAGNPIEDAKQLLAALDAEVAQQGAVLDVVGLGVTGYAADVLQETLRADASVVETVAHMASAVQCCPDVDVICDIGGQDIKVLLMSRGEVRDFRLSNQCSAGNGMLLQAMADQFGVPLTEYADTAFQAELTPKFGYGCAVFLDADRVNYQREGYSKEELLAGLALVLPKNVWQYVVQVPRMASLGRRYLLQGGTQHNLAAVKAQVDYIRARVPDATIHVHPHPGEAGAIGAALEAQRAVARSRGSRFIGLDAVRRLHYTTRNDESTRCHFCPNACARTFVDARTPGGHVSRLITGFSCEKGTVESHEAAQALVARRKALRVTFPNLVDYESRLLFRRFHVPEALPDAGSAPVASDGGRPWYAKVMRRASVTPFRRSSDAAARRRQRLVIGMPRVLNMYSTAPVWRTYFEALGVASQQVVFSECTSEELWAEGSRYGSIDPCYPSKVAQAHVHDLLYRKPRHHFDFIFFPCITHVPSFVAGTMDTASCPVVAGTPKVVRAAFTKERDLFEAYGTEFVDGAVTLAEPDYFAKQMFEMWGERLGVTEDESNWACRQGLAALEALDQDLQRRGMEVLQGLEESHRVGILLLARPYHLDPGLNHGVLDEFQSLGYPVLSIRSIPKDPQWLGRFFREDLERGFISSPLEISDVWPENYSANSVQKVWAAKFAARHPNLVILDLSSFKCGHDAPTYGLIESIVSSGRTPYAALHDIDANKPVGSLNIRIRTYAHTLARHADGLRELAERRSELQRLIDAKRQELWRARLATETRAATGHLAGLDHAYATYLNEDATSVGDQVPRTERVVRWMTEVH